MSEITITTGPLLFAFTSKQHWINKAQSWFANCPYPERVCIDSKGRIVTRGLHFQQAEDDGAYPVNVYVLRAPPPSPPAAPAGAERE